MLQQVTQEAKRVLTRFNEGKQRNKLPRTRAHITVKEARSSPRALAPKTVKVARSPNLDKSVKNRFHHRPAGRNKRSDTQHHDY